MKRTSRSGLAWTGTVLMTALLLVLANQGVAARPALQPDEADLSAVGELLAPSSILVSYQGTLTNQTGDPLNATVTMQFALYDAASGGNLKWGSETQSVPVTNGLFNVLLGSVTPINPSNLTGDLWLDIKVNGEQLTPRESIAGVIRAVMAERADGDFIVNGNLGIGTANPDARLRIVATEGHALIANGPISLWGAVGMHDNLYVDKGFWAGGAGSFGTDVNVGGNLLVSGSTSMWGAVGMHSDLWLDGILYATGGVNCGALTEANLQTPEERAAGGSDRFEEGDVLCWGIDRLEKCSVANDRLVQAVADKGGRPIVIGAELIKVAGHVKRGDYLVTSNLPGYAMASPNPAFGIVIAQALEDFEGERGVIKAMIRKM
jgi:hypothetical protein